MKFRVIAALALACVLAACKPLPAGPVDPVNADNQEKFGGADGGASGASAGDQ